MNERRYIVDILRDILAEISTELLPQLQAYEPSIQGVWYEYGHPIEILETLAQKDQAASFVFTKYPLVALFTDIEESKGTLGQYSTATLNLCVIHQTDPNYKAAERTQKTFKPVIHPIVDAIIERIAESQYFNDYDPDQIRRSETDHYYWGTHAVMGGQANFGNDFWDATELRITVNLSPFCILNNYSTNI